MEPASRNDWPTGLELCRRLREKEEELAKRKVELQKGTKKPEQVKEAIATLQVEITVLKGKLKKVS